MSGFFDRFGVNPLASLGEGIKKISNLGMKYDDLVIKQSRAVGPTEALLGGDSFAPRDLAYAFAMADISQKKYTPVFDKDYVSRREFLRKFALNSEIDFMVTTVADEAIVFDDTNYFAYPSVLNLDIKEEIKEALSNEYKKIYNHFGFVNDITGWHYFRQLLIDGTLAFEIIFDERGQNVIGFKELDAAFMKPDVRNENGILKKVWYLYPDRPALTRMLYDTQVIYIAFAKGNLPSRISYVENLVRSFNLLRIIENAQVMWMLMNSTWRVKMVVPIGAKSPQKAKETLAELMAIYKEDIILDGSTGELSINGSPSVGQFYKNYLFPSKNGEQVDIQTMAGDGPNMQDNTLLTYYREKMKDDSKIPAARFDKTTNGGQLQGSAATGVDREEIRFYKFINRLRSSYQEILIKPLWIQMCLKYKELEEDEIFKSSMGLRWVKDNYFEKIRKQETIAKSMELVSTMQSLQDENGKPFFSTQWLVENFLDLDIDQLNANKAMKLKVMKEAAEEAGGGGEGGSGEGSEGGAPPEGGGGGIGL